jgi:hypothetical protein
MGQVLIPSSCTTCSPPAAAADAKAEDRGMMTCNISCHWKKLRSTVRREQSRYILEISHVRVRKVDCIVPTWVHNKPVLRIHESCVTL